MHSKSDSRNQNTSIVPACNGNKEPQVTTSPQSGALIDLSLFLLAYELYGSTSVFNLLLA